MHPRVYLVDVAVHPLLADHLAGDALGLAGRRLQQRAQLREGDVVVQLGGRQQVVLEHGAVEDRCAVRVGRLPGNARRWLLVSDARWGDSLQIRGFFKPPGG